MLGYSGVAQAGYMLAGVVVGTRLGVQATVLYLIAYLFMNMAAFAVIVARGAERADGDDLSGLAGLGARNPWLAWPMTIAMLAARRNPRHGRLHRQVPADPRARLRRLHLAGDRARDRLDDLARLLPAGGRRDVDAPAGAGAGPGAAATAGPGGLAPIAGGSLEADEWAEGAGAAGAALRYPEVMFVAVVFAAATIFFGIFPSPLFHLASHAANALPGLF